MSKFEKLVKYYYIMIRMILYENKIFFKVFRKKKKLILNSWFVFGFGLEVLL